MEPFGCSADQEIMKVIFLNVNSATNQIVWSIKMTIAFVFGRSLE